MGASLPRVRISPSPLSPAEAQRAKEGFDRVTADAVRLQIPKTKLGMPRKKTKTMHFVYILHCNDNKPYTGCTGDLKARIVRHQKGNVPATANRLPIKLIAYFAFSDKRIAFTFEKYLKSGSGRAFMKKHLINVDNS